MKLQHSVAAQRHRARGIAATLALTGLALLAVLTFTQAGRAQSLGYADVSAGHLFTCAVKEDGNVGCWGFNLWRQAPKSVTGPFTRVAAGESHACALQTDGNVRCWGNDQDGNGVISPPGGPFTQIAAGVYQSCGLRTNGTIDCWGGWNTEAAADPSGYFSQVAAGGQHTCGLRPDGSAHCWGSLGYGEEKDNPGPYKQISAGGHHNCGVKTDGTVACWGHNNYGQSSPPTGTFLQVAAGDLHTCGIKADHTVVCWGHNYYGEVDKAPGGTFSQITAGSGNACAMSTAGVLYCWGRNDFGQSKVPNLGGTAPGFTWEGFYSPVQAAPALNVVKAGSSVPLKFSLGGDKGLQVIAADFPASMQFDCARREPVGDGAATETAGGSSLSYDSSSGAYTYVWKTDKGWAGTCRILALKLADDTWHVAGFRFK